MSSSMRVGDVQVGVDDAVEHGVHHRPRAEPEQVRLRLEVGPDRARGRPVTVADRDDEVAADEEHQVAGLDDLAGLGELDVLDVAGGPHHQERHLAVLLDLGPLPALDGVLDRELVQLEHGRDVDQILRAGLVQAEPDERVLVRPGGGQRLGVGALARLAGAVDVDRAVDDRVAGPDGGRGGGHRGGRPEDPGDGPYRGGERPAERAVARSRGQVSGQVSGARCCPSGSPPPVGAACSVAPAAGRYAMRHRVSRPCGGWG